MHCRPQLGKRTMSRRCAGCCLMLWRSSLWRTRAGSLMYRWGLCPWACCFIRKLFLVLLVVLCSSSHVWGLPTCQPGGLDQRALPGNLAGLCSMQNCKLRAFCHTYAHTLTATSLLYVYCMWMNWSWRRPREGQNVNRNVCSMPMQLYNKIHLKLDTEKHLAWIQLNYCIW